MLNFLMSFLFLLAFVSTFKYAQALQAINRTFLLLLPNVVETGVDGLDEETPDPYFDQSLLEKSVTDYLSSHLRKYTAKYYISFYYYQVESKTVCYERCKGVQIRLKVMLNYGLGYDRRLTFALTENNHG